MASHAYEYLIGLGSNTGDRTVFLNQAVDAIHSIVGPVTALSTIYETEPLGAADALFLNAAIRVLSNLNPDKVLASLLEIEKDLGRIRTKKWGNRTIDLDILLVQTSNPHGVLLQARVDSESLTIPHPEMLQRDFVMIPAAEIAGNWIHPDTHSTLSKETAGRFYRLKKSGDAGWNFNSHSTPKAPLPFVPAPTFI